MRVLLAVEDLSAFGETDVPYVIRFGGGVVSERELRVMRRGWVREMGKVSHRMLCLDVPRISFFYLPFHRLLL